MCNVITKRSGLVDASIEPWNKVIGCARLARGKKILKMWAGHAGYSLVYQIRSGIKTFGEILHDPRKLMINTDRLPSSFPRKILICPHPLDPCWSIFACLSPPDSGTIFFIYVIKCSAKTNTLPINESLNKKQKLKNRS